ncbi:glycosyltransferase [Catenuloplanes sp. NPDC051500]|uniref:glycosyltransferase n=1 Tax=Catenuloplanes sp. NPDC051500 TaxID=3363959 RepID=UPI0037AB8355
MNATATGGGVAEMLRGLVPFQHAAWAVIAGTDEFYAVTKYLHHLLHGQADPGRLDDPAPLATYRATLAPQTGWFARFLSPGDVVVLHDPQTLGLAPAVKATGARVVWHCHIGAEVAPERGPGAVWRAFDTELAAVDAVITTLPRYAPPHVRDRHTIEPAIDLTSPKNRDLTEERVADVLAGIGLTTGRPSAGVTVLQDEPLPRHARVVLQVSRWDPLKDMPGVVRAAAGLPDDVHLVLAGTDPTKIPDDPEGLAVFTEVRALVAALPDADRRRVHLVANAEPDPEQNALVVNALQRRADVVLQKSLQEGFGLTVVEAMVKGRAVVASNVGGLRLQITDGVNGLLVDPADLDGVRAALRRLLDDPALRRTLGERARAGVLERYTMARLAEDYLKVLR